MSVEMACVVPDDCFRGRCPCRSAAECAYPRCENCDNPLGDDGRALDDGRYIPEHYICPCCGGDCRP